MIIDSVIGVPVDCSGRFVGCERMPAALRDAGLDKWPVPDLGNLQVTLADPRRHPEHGIVAYSDLVNATGVIRGAVGDLLRSGRRPLVIGGCCSLLIGTAAAVQDVHPGAGLAFLDGHYDSYPPHSSPTGEAADMELAIVLGVGPEALTRCTGAASIHRPDQVAVLGPRDADVVAAAGAPDPTTQFPGLFIRDADAITAGGAARAAQDALSHLGANSPAEPGGRFWVHVDLDILSLESFPAVDYPLAGGLDWNQLRDLVHPLTHHRRFLGMDVTILNPTQDPDGSTARRTVEWLTDVLT